MSEETDAQPGGEPELPLTERKLLWSIVIVLAVFSLLEGVTILSWGSRIRRLEQQVGPVHVPQAANDERTHPQDQRPQTVQRDIPAVKDNEHDAVAGRSVVLMRVDEFAVENELDESTAAALRELMDKSERLLEKLPAREESGEISGEQRVQMLEEELDRRKRATAEMLGEEMAGKLLDKLSQGVQ